MQQKNKNDNHKVNPKMPDDKINKLKKELEEKDKIINELNLNINNLNNQYKNELIHKSKEAQKKIDEKINEYKTKMDHEIMNIRKYAIKNNAIELINIINQFSNVVNSPIDNAEIRNYVVGFKMFLGMFEHLLWTMNIHEIKINENEKFNENFMEAVDIKIDETKEENTIHKIIKNGYKLHDQVIIYAQVIVYKKN